MKSETWKVNIHSSVHFLQRKHNFMVLRCAVCCVLCFVCCVLYVVLCCVMMCCLGWVGLGCVALRCVVLRCVALHCVLFWVLCYVVSCFVFCIVFCEHFVLCCVVLKLRRKTLNHPKNLPSLLLSFASLCNSYTAAKKFLSLFHM